MQIHLDNSLNYQLLCIYIHSSYCLVPNNGIQLLFIAHEHGLQSSNRAYTHRIGRDLILFCLLCSVLCAVLHLDGSTPLCFVLLFWILLLFQYLVRHWMSKLHTSSVFSVQQQHSRNSKWQKSHFTWHVWGVLPDKMLVEDLLSVPIQQHFRFKPNANWEPGNVEGVITQKSQFLLLKHAYWCWTSVETCLKSWSLKVAQFFHFGSFSEQE